MDVEILAPLGDVSYAEKIIKAGANAVYVGLKNYSSRPSFSDLTMDEIKTAIDVCHKNGVKIYVAINACISHVNQDDVKSAITELDNISVDALILSDFGIIEYACNIVKNSEIHASTLLGVYNTQTVNVLKSMGVKRIIFSTNLYLDEMSKMIEANPQLDYEFVAAGGICFNDNRQCELPHAYKNNTYEVYCRKQYYLKTDGDKQEARSIAGKHIASAEIAQLYIELGIKSFKIEGRTENVEKIVDLIKRFKECIDSIVPNSQSYGHYINRIRNVGETI